MRKINVIDGKDDAAQAQHITEAKMQDVKSEKVNAVKMQERIKELEDALAQANERASSIDYIHRSFKRDIADGFNSLIRSSPPYDNYLISANDASDAILVKMANFFARTNARLRGSIKCETCLNSDNLTDTACDDCHKYSKWTAK